MLSLAGSGPVSEQKSYQDLAFTKPVISVKRCRLNSPKSAARWLDELKKSQNRNRIVAEPPRPRGLSLEAAIRYLAFGAAAAGPAMILRYACASDGMHNCSSNSCFGFQCHSAVTSTYGLVYILGSSMLTTFCMLS